MTMENQIGYARHRSMLCASDAENSKTGILRQTHFLDLKPIHAKRGWSRFVTILFECQ